MKQNWLNPLNNNTQRKYNFQDYDLFGEGTFLCILTIGAQKVVIDPEIKRKSKVTIEENIENKNCSTTWVDPQTEFEPYPDHKKSPLGLQKVKNYPEIKSKSKVTIEENIENKSFSTTYVDPKTIF